MIKGRWVRACGIGVVVLGSWAAVSAITPSKAAAQELTDFDYENLTFRGIGVDVGYIFPNRVDATAVVGVRCHVRVPRNRVSDASRLPGSNTVTNSR